MREIRFKEERRENVLPEEVRRNVERREGKDTVDQSCTEGEIRKGNRGGKIQGDAKRKRDKGWKGNSDKGKF